MSDERPGKWIRVSDNRWRRVSRREFLRLTAAGAAGAGLASTGLARLTGPYIVHAQPRQLRIMSWSHFV
ncbi:MAG: twin-arginine translocation signal domain-containing protein, partial [Pseudomonadota bacterium]